MSKELCILASYLLRAIRRNSVLQQLSVKRFAVIQKEIQLSDQYLNQSQTGGRKGRVECHLHKGDGRK